MRRPATRAKLAPTRAATPVVAQPRLSVWLIAVSLVMVTIALYWPATSHDFVNYDDPGYVLDNPHVTGGLTLEGIKWACLNPVVANWHPVTVWSHMLVCQVFGLGPWGHHVINVLLHAFNAGLVFAFLQGVTGATRRSLLVAVLFAVHPLRVESVAWVSERKDMLSAFFGLLSLIAYARYAEGRTQRRGGRGSWSLSHLPSSIFYLLSLCLFALGLLSKPMLVTWPFVMLLLDYWPLRRLEWATLARLIGEKMPFFAFAVVASVVTFVVQTREGSVIEFENLGLGARGGNALISYCRHLGKLFWPADLAVFYPHPGYWAMWKLLLAGGLLLGISALLWIQGRRYPFLLMGWLWFCGMLVPVIGLVQTGAQSMADRHTYLPSLGVLILTTWGAYELTRRWRYSVLALSVAGGVAIVLCLALTRQQLGYWRDAETLFRHALGVTKDNQVAQRSLGDALDAKGQTDEAISHYQEALRLRPADALVHNNLGAALCKKGRTDEAIREYQEALRLKPDAALAHYNLGNIFLSKGQTDEAIREYQQAIRLKPDYADPHVNLGNAFNNKGQIDEAISHFKEAIRLKPNHADACYNLGNAFASRNQIDEAISQYRKALRSKPDHAGAHHNLAVALGMKGRTDEAIQEYQEALRLKPDDAVARKSLDALLVTKAQALPSPASTNR